MNEEFLVGCDPEFFLKDTRTNSFVAAAGMFPGTKDNPFPLEDGAMQVDGLALEFNINATSSPEEFQKRVDNVLAQMREKIYEVDSKLEPEFVPFANFDAKYFEDLPEDCKILGCDPDYSIRNGETTVNTPPTELMYRPFRTAAGHVHIGWTKDVDVHDIGHMEDCAFIANYFYTLDDDMSRANLERKKYYGDFGAFRPKSYGVELRSPSNRWVGQKNGARIMCETVLRKMQEVA